MSSKPENRRVPGAKPPYRFADPTPDFAPVPVAPRHDGWTPERQAGFLDALAAGGCVIDAARSVGMSSESAYRLRNRPDAVSFRAAWEMALTVGVQRVDDGAVARAANGVTTPIFFQGEQVGERTRHDERLTMFILRARKPTLYGRDRADRDTGAGGHAEVAMQRFLQVTSRAIEDAGLSPDDEEAIAARIDQRLQQIVEEELRHLDGGLPEEGPESREGHGDVCRPS